MRQSTVILVLIANAPIRTRPTALVMWWASSLRGRDSGFPATCPAALHLLKLRPLVLQCSTVPDHSNFNLELENYFRTSQQFGLQHVGDAIRECRTNSWQYISIKKIRNFVFVCIQMMKWNSVAQTQWKSTKTKLHFTARTRQREWHSSVLYTVCHLSVRICKVPVHDITKNAMSVVGVIFPAMSGLCDSSPSVSSFMLA